MAAWLGGPLSVSACAELEQRAVELLADELLRAIDVWIECSKARSPRSNRAETSKRSCATSPHGSTSATGSSPRNISRRSRGRRRRVGRPPTGRRSPAGLLLGRIGARLARRPRLNRGRGDRRRLHHQPVSAVSTARRHTRTSRLSRAAAVREGALGPSDREPRELGSRSAFGERPDLSALSLRPVGGSLGADPGPGVSAAER
jgi:hypothetical protein